MTTFNSTFLAFLNEAQFTKELLAIGVTQLRKANYATKGIYYQSFTCLSTGIERMEKLCLILDYYILNDGILPHENYIRSHGHKTLILFQKCQEIAKQQQIKFRFSCKLNDDIHQSIIEVLNNFSESSGRYSNINILFAKNTEENDCICQWYNNVDCKIYNQRISLKKKAGIESRATVIGTVMDHFASVCYATEDNAELNNVMEASRRTGIWEAVAPYRQLYMLQIIRYLTELLIELGYKAMKGHSEDIPHFGEIFGLFYNDDTYFRGRKTWDKL